MESVMRKAVLSLFVGILLAASATRADVGGKITGVVKDQTSSVIPGALAIVTHTATGITQSVTTGQDGLFTFPVLTVGQYQMDVTADGFKAYRKTGLVIDININHDPRNNNMAFNTKLFSPNALSTFGSSSRRFFYGPGIDNYDMALRKITRVTESASLEFRFETFNTFNHAQFDGATSVDGNRDDATFGQILKSQPGRVSQVALKFQFQFLHVNPGWGFAEQGKEVAVIRNLFPFIRPPAGPA
jgi:Carboxypeptidase regulatory-like domain